MNANENSKGITTKAPQPGEETPEDPLDQPMTFAEHKEQTATDLEAIAAEFTKLAAKVREGDMKAFENMFFVTEVGDGGAPTGGRLSNLEELIVLRYYFREERVERTRSKA